MIFLFLSLGEVSQTEREEYSTPYIWNLKINDTNELTYKTETDSQTYRMKLWFPGGRMRGRDS